MVKNFPNLVSFCLFSVVQCVCVCHCTRYTRIVEEHFHLIQVNRVVPTGKREEKMFIDDDGEGGFVLNKMMQSSENMNWRRKIIFEPYDERQELSLRNWMFCAFLVFFLFFECLLFCVL